MSAQPDREESIFQGALQLPDHQARVAYLDEACGDDLQLRQRVDALLQAHQEADARLNQPAAGARATPPAAAQAASNPTDAPDAPTVVSPAADQAIRAPLTEGPGTVIGHYKLLEQLGEGGMGVVYLAEQEQPVWRKVALKIIKLGMDTKSVIARFEAERQALALMDHPNIAKVFDTGATETGRPFFVMEWVRGVPITEYCDKNHLSARQRLELFLPVCQAIQHAHQKGIIHRDLKPSNVLVALQDGRPVPMVIDFGIAKATHQRLTEKTLFTNLGQMIGTPAYMSPEQAELSKLDVDTRSDIYSLGVLLYELLTGTTPFPEKRLRSAGFGEIQRIIVEEEPERPSTRLSTMDHEQRTAVARNRSMEVSALGRLLRGDLDWIVMKCLEKDRTRRYDAASSLESDIRRHLSNEPIFARPPSTTYRFRKMMHRNKVAFAGVAAVAIALLIGTIGMTALYFRSERLREQSQRNLYVANMNLVQQAWDQNNVGRVRQLLDETAAYGERGFEWYYWQRQTHLDIKTLRGHFGSVSAVAFSPDGQRIVTGSRDNTANVWDAASGRKLVTLKGHTDSILCATFSPDGHRILTGSWDQTAKVWEAATGNELFTLKGHTDQIRSVAFSPDGYRIATGSDDRTAKVWEATDGRQLLTLAGGRNGGILAVAFSPDSRRLAIGGDGAEVLDAASGHKVFTLIGHRDRIGSLAFSRDGQRIVTGSWDQTAKVWDAATGQEMLTLQGHTDWIQSVAFSRDGGRIATGSMDHTVKLWEAVSGRELITFKGHSGGVDSVVLSPDGQRLVTGSRDMTAKIWEATRGHESLSITVTERGPPINSVCFSPDGQYIVSGGADTYARVWETASGREVLRLKGHTNQISTAIFSPDGQQIATGSWDHTAKVWNTFEGREALTLQGGPRAPILCLAFSPDGRRLITGGDGAKVWDVANGRELLSLQGHSAVTRSVAYSPDSRRIATGSGDEMVKIWDAISGRELLTLKRQNGPIYSIAFCPHGQRIATGSGTARVWETATGREILTLSGHKSGILSFAFSTDGKRIVSGSSDQTVKVWETVSGRELLTLRGHTLAVQSVGISQDGKRIVTGSADGVVRVWETASAEQVAAWQKEEQAAPQR